MYFEAIGQMKKQLGQLDKWLETAGKFAQTKSFDPNLFLGFRLSPDQFAFSRQVQATCDVAKLVAARLSGKEAPKHEDNEKTLDELRARVQSVVGYLDGFTANELPWKFEAGTPAIAESIALGAAAEYLEAIGMDVVEAHEHALTEYAYDVLSGIEGVVQYGPKPPNRAGILSFNVGDVHPHDVAQVLDSEGIAVRAGHHCTQPLMRRFGLTATTRASVYIYNGRDDIDALADGIEKVKRTFAG